MLEGLSGPVLTDNSLHSMSEERAKPGVNQLQIKTQLGNANKSLKLVRTEFQKVPLSGLCFEKIAWCTSREIWGKPTVNQI